MIRMIKHIVAFRFKPDVPEERQARILADLNKFPEQYPAMRNWTCGRNISRRDTRYSHAFVIEFDSERELVDYLESHDHEQYVANEFRPYIEERMIVTYEV
jgi:hypothetical protein